MFGAGGVGLATMQAARIAGAAQIVAVDVSPAKEELARAAGATDYVVASATTPRQIRVRLERTCDDATGIVRLETRNIERFGAMKFELVPESLNQELLDKIALMIIGERHNVGKLIKRLL